MESETMYTLNTTEVHAVAYRISSYDSNAMKSPNPHSGIYRCDICNTLDRMNCGYPACNQGGVVIVEGFDGYNKSLTGGVSMTMTAKSSDIQHVPGVVIGYE